MSTPDQAQKCKHQRYKNGHYSTVDLAYKRMAANQIVWIGMRVQTCEDCGADISEHKVVPVKTPEQFMREMQL